MANLLDLFGVVPKAYGGLLDEEELRRLKSQSQQNALMTAASALLQAGAPSKTPTNTGLALLQGLQQGRQGFESSLTGGLQNALTIQKLQEAQQAKAREKQVADLLPQLLGQQAIGMQEVATGGTQMPTGLTQFNRPEAQMSVPVMGQVPVDQALQKLLAIGGPEAFKGIEAYSTLRDVGKPEYFTAGDAVLQRNPEGGLSVAYQAPTKAEKPPSSVQEYQFAVSQGYKGTFEQYQREMKREGAMKLDLGAGQKGFENTTRLKSDFRSEPVYKAHEEMKAAYGQIASSLAQATPIGDTAAATKIMKLLDPGSVVRESELGMAMAATGLLDRVANYAQNIIKGTKLTPAQRKEFMQLGDALYKASVDEYNKKRGEYKSLGQSYGLNTDVALGAEARMPTVTMTGW
jgi:hypothetical protein